MKLKLRQIGFADLVILNKIDLAGVEGASQVKQWIEDHFTRVRLIPAINCDVPLDILLSVGHFDVSRVIQDGINTYPHDHAHFAVGHTHGALFTRWSFVGDRQLSRRSLERMIKRELPGNVYRCKGFVFLAEDPENRYVLQVVGRHLDLVADRSWETDKPQNRIIAIAHKSTLKPDHLTELFNTCVAADA